MTTSIRLRKRKNFANIAVQNLVVVIILISITTTIPDSTPSIAMSSMPIASLQPSIDIASIAIASFASDGNAYMYLYVLLM